MARLTAAERLAKVKIAMQQNGHNFNDETISFWIEEVIEDLVDGGVKREIAESAAAVGCIAIGVNDLWNYSSGNVKYSPRFEQRLIQLSAKKVNENV